LLVSALRLLQSHSAFSVEKLVDAVELAFLGVDLRRGNLHGGGDMLKGKVDGSDREIKTDEDLKDVVFAASVDDGSSGSIDLKITTRPK
jgi:hypothetical protein